MGQAAEGFNWSDRGNIAPELLQGMAQLCQFVAMQLLIRCELLFKPD
ncbi:MAG: hypothetical protein IT306_06020 [Chloroflexi bacterium]|nr:hypothetical protein [Chloroflexota bacterium]